jgi:gliding motility-associated-like protein
MQSTLDSMIALIQPEMQRHINKWGGSTATWLQNVQSLKNFIDQRCTQIQQGMIDCYTLTGPYSVTVDVDPPNSGTVKINSINPPSYPWNCSYYGGMLTLLKATPNASAGYSFDYWELNIDPVTPDSTKDSVSTSISANEIIIAHFKKEETPKDTTTLIMPNVFTPNGDGFNDYFKPNIITKFTSSSLEIYNRWGKLIFKTNDLQAGWDGKVKGKMSSDGVYYWILDYTDLDNAPKEMKGALQLINNK